MRSVHNRKIRIALAILSAILCLICISTTVFAADSGPKPSIKITIKNPPEGDYYVALLESRYQGKPPETLSEEVIEARIEEYEYDVEYGRIVDDPVCETFYTYYEAGYTLHRSPVGNNIHPSRANHEYTFGYMVPGTFKVMVVTADGQVFVSNAITRKAFYAECVYDHQTGILVERAMTFRSTAKYLTTAIICYVITLLVEAFILGRFHYPYEWNKRPFILINTVTQVFLNFVVVIVPLAIRSLSSSLMTAFLWLFAEIFVIVIEVIYLRPRLKDYKGEIRKTKTGLCVVLANIVSVLAELPIYLILVPVLESF